MTRAESLTFALIGVLIALVLFTCSHLAPADDASRQLTPLSGAALPGVGTVQSADAGAFVAGGDDQHSGDIARG
jgi:hypothetical protein